MDSRNDRSKHPRYDRKRWQRSDRDKRRGCRDYGSQMKEPDREKLRARFGELLEKHESWEAKKDGATEPPVPPQDFGFEIPDELESQGSSGRAARSVLDLFALLPGDQLAAFLIELMGLNEKMIQSDIRRVKRLQTEPLSDCGSLRFGPIANWISERLEELKASEEDRLLDRVLRDESLMAEIEGEPWGGKFLTDAAKLDASTEDAKDQLKRGLKRLQSRKS